jgi:hypothetical protein
MRGAAFILGSFLVTGCWRFGAVHPQIGIEIASAHGEVTFTFVNCLNRAELPINEVAVYANDDGPKGRPPVCKLQAHKDNYGRTMLSTWRYGAEPVGYSLGVCKRPLPVGQYSVHALGSGVGTRPFVVDSSGNIQATAARCR